MSGESEQPICEECFDSPSTKETYNNGGDPSARTHLRVKGAGQWLDARGAALAWISANRVKFGDLPVKSIEIKPIEGSDCWDVFVEYGYRTSEGGVALDYRFSTSGGKARVTRTRRTVCSRSCVAGLPAYDFGGAIGVGSDGRVDGVDIKSPAFSWSQTQAFSVSRMTREFRRMLADYTATVNSEEFMGYEPGEVLFEGVTDGQLCREINPNTGNIYYYYKLTFSFSVSPNVSGIVIGDAVVDKKGWEYLWILWETTVSGSVKTKFPRNVCVERVYAERDLNDLGLAQF